jgi:hypothetical protein
MRTNKLATKPQTKSEPKTQIERIRDVSPKYAALITRQAELTSRYDAIIEEANGPKDRVDGTLDGKTGEVRYSAVPLAEQFRRSLISWVSQLPKPRPKPVVRNAAAVELVGSDLLSPESDEEINTPEQKPLWSGQDRLAALGAEADVIAAALQLIAPEIRNARKQYSQMVAEQSKEEYQALVTNILDMARGLGQAIQTHHEWTNKKRLDGVAYALFKPINLEAFGNLNEAHTPILAMLIDAAAKGHISPADLPQFKMPIDISHLQGGN